MNIRYKNRIVGQINWMVAFILIVAGILTSFGITYVVEETTEEVVLEDIDTKSKSLIYSLLMTEKINKQLERRFDQALYTTAMGLGKELKGRKIHSISSGELSALSDKWGVDDISLWSRQGDNFVVTQSSDLKEIGLSTGDQEPNFWVDAFFQLWDRKPVSVGHGWYKNNFWVGPVVDSTSNRGPLFYKYASYYDGGTEFLINVIVEATDLYQEDYTAQIIEDLSKDKYIKDISVINVKPFLMPMRSVHNAKTDIPVLYGKNPFVWDEEKKVIERLRKNEMITTESIDFNHYDEENNTEHSFRKFYIKFPATSVERMVMMVIDMEQYEDLKRKIVVGILTFFIFIILIILFLIQWITRRQLKPMQDITRHIERVSEGDFSSRLSIPDKNEFGWLGQNLNDMTGKMGEMIEQVNEQANEKITFTQSTYNEELKKLLTSVKSFRHDFHNHITVIKGLIQIGSTQRALDYLADITKEVKRVSESLDIKNPELSVFFHSKFLIAENNQVPLKCEIDADPFDLIPSLDQIKMYGNLIDNALEEVLKLPVEERAVHMTLKREPDFYYFRVDNTGDEIPSQHLDRLFELGFSTKPPGESKVRGSGLPIVKQTIEKYDGRINVFRNNHMNCFEVIIPIPKTETK